MTSVYKQQLLNWVSSLDVKADTVIDIGGSQDPIKGRTKSWEVKKYLIADLPQPHYEKQKPDIEFNLENKFYKPRVQADLIFCLEVFDYIRDPITAFDRISAMLKDGGSAWVSFPFFYPIHNPVESEGLRYTEPALRYYGDLYNIPVKEVIYRRPESRKLLEYISEDGFRAAKDYNHNVIGYIVRFQK